MSDSELQEERRGIVRQLLDALFGRSEMSEEEMNEGVHRIGTINRRLEDHDG